MPTTRIVSLFATARRILVLLILSVGHAVAQTPASMVKCADTDPQSTGKAINGAPAAALEWPWFAALMIRDATANEITAICGGAVIAPNWVLTAGHCLQFIDKSSFRASKPMLGFGGDLQLVIGASDLRDTSASNTYDVQEIVMEDQYAAAYTSWLTDRSIPKPPEPALRIGHDLALIKLARPWLGPLAPIATNAETDYLADSFVRVAGFGTVEIARNDRDQLDAAWRSYPLPSGQTLSAGCARLMQVTMPVVATASCAERYTTPSFKPTITDEQICAGYEEPNQDSCNGDSGGPLVASSPSGALRYIGVVSWGPANCGGAKQSYGVYTRISKFSNWIEKTTGLQLTSLDRPAAGQAPSVFRLSALNDLDIDLRSVKGKVRVTVEGGPVVKLGNEYKFIVESDVSGRLIILDVDAGDKITQIFPNRYMTSETATRIQGGTRTTIPAASWGFSAFKAAEPVGRGTLVALVVPDNFPTLTLGAEMEEQRQKGFLPVRNATSYLMNLLQQVGEYSARARENATLTSNWAFDSVRYEIWR